MDVLIFMQLSANDFRVRTKGRNKTTLQETLSVRYFNIINIAQRWCEISCTSEGSVINQS